MVQQDVKNLEKKATQWYPNTFVYPILSKQVTYFEDYEGEEAIIFDD